MPWARTDVNNERVKFVIRAASGRERVATLCREFGISRPTGYRWRNRSQSGGSLVAAVQERSRRPLHSPAQTDPAKEWRVVELRRQYGWGAKKIRVLLEEEGISLPLTTIHRILKRRDLIGLKESHAPALERFERAAPNELWQMDGKGEYRASGGISIRCRSWTTTAATPWGCTPWALSARKRSTRVWCARLSAMEFRATC